MRVGPFLCVAMFVSALALPAMAQSPNTAAIVVVVVDQTGGIVSDAKVTVVNSATGATREAMSGADGSATFAALSLTGSYAIDVTKTGFTAEKITDLTLRAGETATGKSSSWRPAGQPKWSSTVRIKAFARIRR